MTAEPPGMERIRVTPLSHQVWPGLVCAALYLAFLWEPTRRHGFLPLWKPWAVLLGLLGVVAWFLWSPYLMLGRSYLRVRGPRSLRPRGWLRAMFIGPPGETYDEGALIRLADVASWEVRGHTVVLTWWHHARKERISLRGVRARDRERFLAYLEERLGRGPKAEEPRE